MPDSSGSVHMIHSSSTVSRLAMVVSAWREASGKFANDPTDSRTTAFSVSRRATSPAWRSLSLANSSFAASNRFVSSSRYVLAARISSWHSLFFRA